MSLPQQQPHNMSLPQQQMLRDYVASGAAGNYNRLENKSGVADVFRDNTNQYGPSHREYTIWKKSGTPTAETLQSTVFGVSSKPNSNLGAPLRETPLGKSYAHTLSQRARANPITWMGDEAPPPVKEEASPPAPVVQFQPQPEVAPPPQLTEEQQQQTWSSLMRNGSIKPTAAQCMVDMPAMYSAEPPPPRPSETYSMQSIGMHRNSKPVRRSSAFTSDFRDPFL